MMRHVYTSVLPFSVLFFLCASLMMGAGCCERGAESEKLRAEVASLRSEVETLRHRVERMEREAVASARPSRGAPSSAADRRDLMQRREAMKDPELRRKFI